MQINLGSGFKYVLFSPLFGEDSHFDSYFSKGLKPPTRCFFALENHQILKGNTPNKSINRLSRVPSQGFSHHSHHSRYDDDDDDDDDDDCCYVMEP